MFFDSGGTNLETWTSSLILTAKEKLYRDTLAKALAKRSESLPASKRMKVTTKHPFNYVHVDESIKRCFILLYVLVLCLTKDCNYLKHTELNKEQEEDEDAKIKEALHVIY